MKFGQVYIANVNSNIFNSILEVGGQIDDSIEFLDFQQCMNHYDSVYESFNEGVLVISQHLLKMSHF